MAGKFKNNDKKAVWDTAQKIARKETKNPVALTKATHDGTVAHAGHNYNDWRGNSDPAKLKRLTNRTQELYEEAFGKKKKR